VLLSKQKNSNVARECYKLKAVLFSGKRPGFVGGMKTRSGREKKKLNKLRADDGLFDLGKLRGVENGRDEVHV
jgi:hypothetical protein